MKRLNKKTAIIIILAIVLSVSITVAGVVTYATYTNSSHAQRIIATYEKNGARFSSNILRDAPNTRYAIYTQTTSIPDISVTVCNYEQGKANYHDSDIYYKLTATIVTENDKNPGNYDEAEDDCSAYIVTITNSQTSDSITLGSTTSDTLVGMLATGDTDWDSYVVRFTGDAFLNGDPKHYLKLEATPYDSEDDRTNNIQSTKLGDLSMVIEASQKAEGARTSWTGAFSDSTSSHAPSDYDGFNYRIHGSGSGNFKLRWDSRKVALSEHSLTELGKTATQVGSTTYYEITIAVDSIERSVYDLQFYKKQPTDNSWSWSSYSETSSWTNMNGDYTETPSKVVEFKFTEG